MEQEQYPASSAGANGFLIKNGYIEHHVSKLDTLAGVAIKYGVEVADVKRSNGLVTDLQMFAHKTLRIPVGRRHPFAPAFVKSESSRLSGVVFGYEPAKGLGLQALSIQRVEYEKRFREKRPLSSAMNLLRGYYGLSPPAQQANGSHGGVEMMTSSYKPEVEEHSDEEPFSPITVPFTNSKACHRKTSDMCNCRNAREEVEESRTQMAYSQTPSKERLPPTLGLAGESNSNDRVAVRRRFKTDAANAPSGPDEGSEDVDDDGEKQDISGILEKVLLGAPENASGLPVALLKVFDGTLVGGKANKESPVSKVKKSSSTSSLQDQPSSQANLGVQRLGLLAQGGGPRTFFDMPPKPLTYRYKEALD